MPDLSVLEWLDGLLAQHPFGNSEYITQQLHICYKRRLQKISRCLPAAAQFLDALNSSDAYTQYRTIGDTVVRCAVQHAMRQIETGAQYGLPLEQCEEVFRATNQHLDHGRLAPLGSGLLNRLGPSSFHGWICSEERANDGFVHCFRRVVQDNFGEMPSYTPSIDELAMLSKGAQLLGELLPLLSRSALSHAHLIVIFSPIGASATR